MENNEIKKVCNIQINKFGKISLGNCPYCNKIITYMKSINACEFCNKDIKWE